MRPLKEVLAEIKDFRKEKGRRHQLSAILALASAAVLCGCKTYSAIAQWGRDYGAEIAQAIGFKHHKPPSAATFYRIFKQIDKQEIEEKLAQWSEPLIASRGDKALAADGKTLRGSRKQAATGTHLLSIVSHQLGLSVAQQAVDDKTNEIPVLQQMIKGLVLTGKVMTMDALNTQRETARAILDSGADYVMIVKDNQPALLKDIKEVFNHPLDGSSDRVEQLAQGHGRIEYRRLTTSSILSDYSDWPGLAQVFELQRLTNFKKTAKVRHEIVYGISSLNAQSANAEALLTFTRGQWTIENKVHYVRDVTFDEDRSQVRNGNIAQVMAALRNTAMGLMRFSGISNIAAACRSFAAQPWLALALLGFT